jgi:hypothetical protein
MYLAYPEMMQTYRRVARLLDGVLETEGTKNPFEARVLKDICFVAKANSGGL